MTAKRNFLMADDYVTDDSCKERVLSIKEDLNLLFRSVEELNRKMNERNHSEATKNGYLEGFKEATKLENEKREKQLEEIRSKMKIWLSGIGVLVVLATPFLNELVSRLFGG